MSVVITNLIGGLGNQMFQYAAGRVLALRHGAELKLDLSGFADYPLRRYELGAFPIAAETLDKVDGAPVAASAKGWRGRIGRLMGAAKRRRPRIRCRSIASRIFISIRPSHR